MSEEKEQLRIEHMPLAALKRAARNPKKHAAKDIQDSIGRFGFRAPMAIDERTGKLIAGHGRLDALLALQKAKAKPPAYVLKSAGDWLVPVVRGGRFQSKADAEAYLLADNQLTIAGGWDEEMLATALRKLKPLGDAAFAGMGFSESELSHLLAGTEIQEDDPGPLLDRAAELQKKWKTKRGQVWEIGKNRLVCGDATALKDVAILLNGAKPFLIVTDPPYGVEYDPAWRTKAAEKGYLSFGPSRVGKVTNDDRADWKEAWDLFPGDVIYSWCPQGATSLVHAKALQDSGFALRMQIIWAKSNFPIGRGDYHIQHELCWYAVREGKPAHRTKDRTQTTLWEIKHDLNVDGGHSTQKPVECMARPIRNHDCKDVYDPFLGSGTTMVAAEQLGRICYAMEIEPKYVAVNLERMAKLGLKPRLAK